MDSGTNNNNNNSSSSGSGSSSNSNRITAVAAAIAVAAAASLSQLQKRKREHDPPDHHQQAEPRVKAPRLGAENGEAAEESGEGNSEGSEAGSEEEDEDEDEDEDEEDDEEDDDPDGGDAEADDETAIETQEKEETIHPYWRPVQFFHDMIKDPSGASPTYKTLDPMQKLIFALGIRNLYLATRRSSSAVRDGDRQILQGMQRLVDEDDAPIDVEGLQVSFYPSATYSELRHFEDLDRKIAKHKNVNYYAQVGQSPRMFAAFAKPAAS